MRVTRFWILVVLLLSAQVLTTSDHSAEIGSDEGVLALDSKNFGAAYKAHPNLLIEYYAPWCGVCERFAPQYIQLVKQLKRTVPGIELAKIDCEENKEFCEAQGVLSYPTLIYYDHKREIKYGGRPTMLDVLAWFDKMLNPIEKIDDYAKLHHRRKKNEHSVVLVAEPDSEFVKIFSELSGEVPEFKWIHYFDPSNEYMKLTPPRVIVNNSASEETIIDLTEVKDKASILRKIEVGRYPLVKKYEVTSISEMIFERNKPALFFIVDKEEMYEKYQEVLEKINKEFLETAPVVIYVRDNIKNSDKFLNYFGVKTFPMLLYMKQTGPNSMVKYFYKGDLTFEGVKAFAEKAVAGKLKMDYKSEPENPLNTTVLELVGSNFRDIVNDSVDAIVTYYAPDCKFCDDFKPTFDQVAKEYKDAGSPLIFARANIRFNDVGVAPQAIPTILLHKKGSFIKPVDFTDVQRTPAQLKTFLANNGFKLIDKKAEEERIRREKAESDAKAAKEKSEREAREKIEREARAEREARERAERDAKERTEREAREKTERETKDRTEREARERTEREAKAKASQESKQAEEASKLKAERDAKAQAEAIQKSEYAEREARLKAEQDHKKTQEKAAQDQATAQAQQNSKQTTA